MTANDRFLHWLDRSVGWTGVPAMAERQQAWINGREPAPYRRHLRWWPMLALALAVGGFAVCVAWGDPRRHAAGYSAVMAGYALSLAFPLFGPLKPWGQSADERERAVRRDAFFFAFATISVLAVLGLWGLSAGVLIGEWGAGADRRRPQCGSVHAVRALRHAADAPRQLAHAAARGGGAGLAA